MNHVAYKCTMQHSRPAPPDSVPPQEEHPGRKNSHALLQASSSGCAGVGTACACASAVVPLHVAGIYVKRTVGQYYLLCALGCPPSFENKLLVHAARVAAVRISCIRRALLARLKPSGQLETFPCTLVTLVSYHPDILPALALY